jgi:murein DD-endopeptidase MepM/ murein hydrolase activator NlpD
MHKDDRFYTFLLTHSSKTKIYIRRVEISKKFVRNSAASLIFSVGLAAFGIAGFFRTDDSFISKINSQAPNNLSVVTLNSGGAASVKAKNSSPRQNQNSINYDRPDPLDAMNNTGGPLTLSNVESESEEQQLSAQLHLIETTGNPAHVPSMWAHQGKINNEYGFRRNPFGGRTYEFHAGMDIDGERGDAVIAPANGIVTKAGWQGGYGNLVEIDHQNGLTTRYGHLSRVEVQVGEPVGRGQLIGQVGSTGRSTGPHLHYELRLNDKAINPRRFLPPEPMELSRLNQK